jgi:CBS-domain-containing membrane protein/PII-like signaling protein
MHSLINVKFMKIFLGEAARFKGRPLHEAIVDEARGRGLAGATVSRGMMGFGANSLVHTSKILRLSEDLPIMVEIVDTPERIDAFLPVANAMVEDGSIVVSEAKAIFHLPLRIRDVMTSDVATVTPETPLAQVVELLLRRGIKAVPVVDGKGVTGIITGGDLLSRGGMPLSLDMQCALPSAMRNEHVQCLDFQDLRAANVMSAPVQTLNIKTKVSDALQFMAKGGLKRLPVVSDDGSLMGIVSRADVLKAMGLASSVAGHLDVLPDGIRGFARDVMYRSVPTASSDTPLTIILEKVVASPLRRVVIVDGDDKILGIVHDRDLLKYFAHENAPGIMARLIGFMSQPKSGFDVPSGTAKDVMTTSIITVPPQLPLSDVIRTLLEHRIKRVAVADESGRLLGMVDRDTVLKGLAG